MTPAIEATDPINKKRAMALATSVFDALIESHYGLDKVDRDALASAAAEYLKHAAGVINPPLLHLAYETALTAQDWLSRPTPENWQKLRKASQALETELL
jgi:DMSO/TMAO reductase YedYZ heme-binding membrane subunit